MSTTNTTTALAPSGSERKTALGLMAANLNLEPERMKAVLKATVFKNCSSDEELAALVVVANQFGLNPILKELYAYPAKGGGVVPVVSLDGWVKLAQSHPQMDGMSFEMLHDEKGNLYAATCRIYRKDRTHPVEITEYLSECRRPTEPWKMEHRMLRHKALKECARYAFGFSGIYDEDDARDMDANPRNVTPQAQAEQTKPRNAFSDRAPALPERSEDLPSVEAKTVVVEASEAPPADQEEQSTEERSSGEVYESIKDMIEERGVDGKSLEKLLKEKDVLSVTQVFNGRLSVAKLVEIESFVKTLNHV